MKKILIVGANSAIARAYALTQAEQHAELFLVARDEEKLQQTAADLKVRGASNVHTYVLDIDNVTEHSRMIENCFMQMRQVETVLIAHGTLPDQNKCQESVSLSLTEFATNGTHTIALLTALANKFERQKFGTIAVITSVAGDRGRPSNYVYGAAKAAVSIFCEGLRARLYKFGVHVIDIRPGFVDTPMTQGLKLPKLLLVKPEKIALYINKAVTNQKDVVYAPWFWFWILLIIRNIPSFIFKKLNL